MLEDIFLILFHYEKLLTIIALESHWAGNDEAVF